MPDNETPSFLNDSDIVSTEESERRIILILLTIGVTLLVTTFCKIAAIEIKLIEKHIEERSPIINDINPFCKCYHSVRDYSGWDQGVPVRCEFGLQATQTALGANLDARLPNLRISPRDGVYPGHCSLVHCGKANLATKNLKLRKS